MQIASRSDLVRRLFAMLDEMKGEFVNLFTEDARYRFGNTEPVVGRASIRDAVVNSFPLFKALHHNIQAIWEQGNVVIAELEVTHTLHQGKVVTLPVADIFQFEGNLICDVRIYIDPSPLGVAD